MSRKRTRSARGDNDDSNVSDDDVDEIATSAVREGKEAKETKQREVKRQPSAFSSSSSGTATAAVPVSSLVMTSSSASSTSPHRPVTRQQQAIDYSEYAFSEDDASTPQRYQSSAVARTPDGRLTRNSSASRTGPVSATGSSAPRTSRDDRDNRQRSDDEEEDSDELASSSLHVTRRTRKRRRVADATLASPSFESKRSSSLLSSSRSVASGAGAMSMSGASSGAARAAGESKRVLTASSSGSTSGSEGAAAVGFSLAAPSVVTPAAPTNQHHHFMMMAAAAAAQDDEPLPPTFVKDLLSYIHCQVCQSPITFPILQCQLGHLLCTDCARQLRRSASDAGISGGACPTCRTPLPARTQQFARNLALEKLVQDTTLMTCRFRFFGCKMDKIPYLKCREHIRECPFAQVPCLAGELYSSKCSWCGPYADLATHMQHGCEDPTCKPTTYFQTSSGGFLHLPFDKVCAGTGQTIVHAYEHDFLLMSGKALSSAGSAMSLVFVMVGTPAESRRYTCTLIVSADNPQNSPDRPETLSSSHCPLPYVDFLRKASEKKLGDCWRMTVPVSLLDQYSSGSSSSFGASAVAGATPKKLHHHTPRCLYARITLIDSSAASASAGPSAIPLSTSAAATVGSGGGGFSSGIP